MRTTLNRRRLVVERLEPRLCMSFGALDTRFGVDGFVGFENIQTADSNDEVCDAVALSDGSTLIVGISEAGSGRLTSFAKLDATGQLVTSFGDDGQLLLPDSMLPRDAVAASDGSVYVAASRLLGDGYQDVVFKMLPDGTIDSTFGGVGYVIVDPAPSFYPRLAPTLDGGVAVLANYFIGMTQPWFEMRILKLTATGGLDASFGVAGETGPVDPCALRPDGTTSNSVYQFLTDELGRLLVIGSVYSSAEQTLYLRSLRFTASGELDTTFGEQGALQDLVAVPWRYSVTMESGSSALLVVWTEADYHATTIHAARITADGHQDLSFGTDGLLVSPTLPASYFPAAAAVPLLADAGNQCTVVVVPQQVPFNEYRFLSMVIGADGQFDTTYGESGIGHSDPVVYKYLSCAGALAITDGRIRVVASGYDDKQVRPPIDWRVFGLDAQGDIDRAFGGDGIASIDFTRPSSYVGWLDLQSADNSLVALYGPHRLLGNPQRPSIGKAKFEFFHRTGERDTDRPSNGLYTFSDAVIESNFAWSPLRGGGWLTAGVTTSTPSGHVLSVRKWSATGELDVTFGNEGSLRVPTYEAESGFRPLLKQTAAGDIYMALQTNSTLSPPDHAATAWIARANAQGELDLGFGFGGVYSSFRTQNTELIDFAVLPNGMIGLLFCQPAGIITRMIVVMLDATGQADAAFANQGEFILEVQSPGQMMELVADEQGRLLCLYRAKNELHVHRITSAGQSDASFGIAGDVLLPATTRSFETFADIALLHDSILVAATTGIDTTVTSVFALHADGSLVTDFGQAGVATLDVGEHSEHVRDLDVWVDGSVILGLRTTSGFDSLAWIVKLQGMDPSPVPLHNVFLPLNTTLDDDLVTPRDALLVINYLTGGRAHWPGAQDPAQMGYVDVNADSIVSPIDVLLIINHLTRPANGPDGGEGEADGLAADRAFVGPGFLPELPLKSRMTGKNRNRRTQH